MLLKLLKWSYRLGAKHEILMLDRTLDSINPSFTVGPEHEKTVFAVKSEIHRRLMARYRSLSDEKDLHNRGK